MGSEGPAVERTSVSPEQNPFSERRKPIKDQDLNPALETCQGPTSCSHLRAVLRSSELGRAEQQGQHKVRLPPSWGTECSSVGPEARDRSRGLEEKAKGRALSFREAGGWTC